MSSSQEFSQYDNFTGFKKFIDTCHLLKRQPTHQSKSRKVHSKSSKLNREVKVEKSFQLRRTSSYDSLNICEHCVHDHNRVSCG